MSNNIPKYVTDTLSCPFCASEIIPFDGGWKCDNCHEVYRDKNGQADFRLKKKKTVSLQFDMGVYPFPEDFQYLPLASNDNPEVDYSSLKIPIRLSKEQLSFIPKANDNDRVMLDLGCGHAFHREVCEHAGYRYVGMDYDEPEAPLLGDAHALPFKDKSFDFILSIAVLEHIYNPFVMMKEAFRVLKPGGKIVGTVAFLEPFHANSCYHHTHLGTYYTLSTAGFNVEKVAPSVDWSVLEAQKGLLFARLPKIISKGIILPVQVMHRIWWKAASMVNKKATEQNRILHMTGSFTFVASKPP